MVNENLALFLGMLCGDGYLSIRSKRRGSKVYYDHASSFCNTNLEIMSLFDNLFYKIFKIKGNFHPRDRPNRKRIYEFNSYSQEVFNKISKLGFPIGVKRDVLKIPSLVKEGSKKEKTAFLFGVFITDGSLKKDKTIMFHSGSKLFLEDLSELIFVLLSVKRPVKSYLQREKFLSYQLTLNKLDSQKLLSMPLSHNGIAPVLSSEKFNFLIHKNNK